MKGEQEGIRTSRSTHENATTIGRRTTTSTNAGITGNCTGRGDKRSHEIRDRSQSPSDYA
jgi:hypothetical protein